MCVADCFAVQCSSVGMDEQTAFSSLWMLHRPSMASCSQPNQSPLQDLQQPLVAAQEVFLTPHHLAIAMEYAPGGDLSLLVDQCRARGVSADSADGGLFVVMTAHS